MPHYDGTFSPLEVAIATDYNEWFDQFLVDSGHLPAETDKS